MLKLGLRTLFGMVILGAWQAAWEMQVIQRDTISSPVDVARTISSWITDGTMASNLPITLLEVGAGLAIGVASGMLVALILSGNRRIFDIINPLISSVNAIPLIILVPLFTLALGPGVESKVAISSILVFFAVFFNVIQALNAIDHDLVSNLRIQGATATHVIVNVTVPMTFVRVVSSLRTIVGLAFLGVLVAEYLGSTTGMGYVIADGANLGNITDVISGLVTIALIVLTIELALTQIDKRLVHWREF